MSTLQTPTFELMRQPTRTRKLATVARYLTLLLLLGLFVGTHIPSSAIPQPIAIADKVAHCLAYMALAFSVLVSWDLAIGQLRPQHFFIVWLVGTIYGAFDELTQIPVGRHCDPLDWMCDILGLVIGLTLFRLLRPLLSWLLHSKFAVK